MRLGVIAQSKKRMASLLTFGTLALGLPGIAFRLAHLSAIPLPWIDRCAVACGVGLFAAALYDFAHGRIRRGTLACAMRFLLTICVAVRLDVPLAMPTLTHWYAAEQMREAITPEQRLHASLVVLSLVDGSPLVTLLASTPREIVAARRCPTLEAEYDTHVLRRLPALEPFLQRYLMACRRSRLRVRS